jgi:hypothetical protein
MNYITFKKSDSIIIDLRVDTSVPEFWTIDKLKTEIAKSKNISIDEIETVSMTNDPVSDPSNCTGTIAPLSHLFDSISQTVKNNPNFVHKELPRLFNANHLREAMTFPERVKWDNNKSESIITAKIEFQVSRNEHDTIEILQFLVDTGDITAATMGIVIA